MPNEPGASNVGSDQEFNQLFRTFSHDLRQSLTKIITISEFLAKQLPDIGPTEKDYLARMGEAGKAADQILTSTSDYIKLLQSPMTPEAVPLKPLLEETLGELAPVLAGAQVEIRVPDSVGIRADRFQMKKAFYQLISNAAKFRKKGAIPQIVIECPEAETDGWVRIQISDDGVGFEEKYAPQIWEPYQRLHNKREYPGVGLGLTLARKVVQNHGGRIGVRSGPGEGTRLWMELPPT